MRARAPIVPLAALSLFVGFAGARPASAHIRLDFPTGRYSDDFLKSPPCGKGSDDPRSTNANTFEPGATITVRWTETIDHTGYFRVAFDADGNDFDDFEDPSHQLGRKEDPTNLSGVEYTMDVTLPNEECDNCTLQLIQDMGGSVYYQCADLVLKKGAGNDQDDGGQSGCAATSSGELGWAAVILLAVRTRRRAA